MYGVRAGHAAPVADHDFQAGWAQFPGHPDQRVRQRRACRIALLSSSLITSAASAAGAATIPALRNSARNLPRATPTPAGTNGSTTTLAALTSPRVPAPWPE